MVRGLPGAGHSLFEQQFEGQGVALGPALQTAVQRHALVLPALLLACQLLCGRGAG